MTHIVLIGDSIFDNAAYVDKGESVRDRLKCLMSGEGAVSLIAVDGDITTDVPQQLASFPSGVTHAFISCGGNDALRIVHTLEKPISTIGNAMEVFSEIREQFRLNYAVMLRSIIEKIDNPVVCTIYNSVPGVSERALTALALFNEVILLEAISLGLPILDLRLLLTEASDYSSVSPIEPSGLGAIKIANSIFKILHTHPFDSKHSIIYV